jgi:uncharacterized membrane protein
MATRYVSDTARANWSTLLSGIVGVGAAFGVAAARGSLASLDLEPLAITVYLFMWPAFAVIYLVWTHLAYANHGPRALGSRARRERETQQRWWSALIGYGGASSWTLAAAVVAVVVSLIIAQTPDYRSDPLYVGLGLLCVASSWALMVYAFALQYLRLGGSDDGTEHIGFELEGDARFGDYLTLAILLSTMAATVSATVRTREAWRVVRANVLFAFTFNSVIVAMVVSLLLGGLFG